MDEQTEEHSVASRLLVEPLASLVLILRPLPQQAESCFPQLEFFFYR